jgi:hypothetical protein
MVRSKKILITDFLQHVSIVHESSPVNRFLREQSEGNSMASVQFRNLIRSLIAIALALGCQSLYAADISYGGRLSEASGAPLTGPVDITFNFYTSGAATVPSYTITQNAVLLTDGVFHVTLDLPAPQLQSLLGNGDKTFYIEVVSGGKPYPRQLFHPTPLALRVPIDDSKLIYDSAGRLTFSSTALSGVTSGGTHPLANLTSTGIIKRLTNGTYETLPVTDAGKALIEAATIQAQQTALGLGTLATLDSLALTHLSVEHCANGQVPKIVGGAWDCVQLKSSDLTGPLVNSEFRLNDTNSDKYIGLKAGSNLSNNITLTLPDTVGSTGQLLSTSGSGVLTWVSAPTAPVTSVNGQIGSVLITTDQVSQGVYKYYSDVLARGAISATSPLSYNSNTGALSLSYDIVKKDGDSMNGNLSMGNHKVTDLADPTSATDAATKNYADSYFAGFTLDQNAKVSGSVVKWDGTNNKFYFAPDLLGQAGGGIATVNGLNDSSQNLAASTTGVSAGTRPTWSSVNGTHTLVFPMALESGVSAGLLSHGDWSTFNSASVSANGATSANTASKIVMRDGSGNFIAGTITAHLSGNVTGDVTGNVSGSAASFTSALAGDVSGTQGATVVSRVGSENTASIVSGVTAANAATDTNSPNKIVARDASGNFSAGTITASLTGNVTGTATNVTGTVAIANGGTGATTAAVGRTNLGAAASGANSDITSLTGLTTPLSVAHGGTGASSASPFVVFAGPSVGPTAGAPTFRSLVSGDIPWATPGTLGSTTPSSAAFTSVTSNAQIGHEFKPFGTTAGNTSEIRFDELAANGTHYIGFKSPDLIPANTIWTLPNTDGVSGQVLRTDGAGTLSWTSSVPGSGTTINTGTGLSGGPITSNGTISIANVGTPGTYTKVTTNAQGQVASGTTLAAADIPNLDGSKITTGTVPGGARAWVNFNGANGGIRKSYNVSSVSRISAGVYTLTFSSAMPDAEYVVSGSASGFSGYNSGSSVMILGVSCTGVTPDLKTTSQVRVVVVNNNNDTEYDVSNVHVVIYD